jgi:hypothetical protein
MVSDDRWSKFTKSAKSICFFVGILLLFSMCRIPHGFLDDFEGGSDLGDRPIEGNAKVTLEWDPNSEPDISGYRLYYGHSIRTYPYFIDVGNHTTYTLTGLSPTKTYYIAVTAYNTYDAESDFSNEIVFIDS